MWIAAPRFTVVSGGASTRTSGLPNGGRILQFTPPGSPCSILIGSLLTPSAPGSTQFVHLVVSDIVVALADLSARGVVASAIFHDADGGYNRFDPARRASGPDPDRRSYASFATFDDPDGNGFVLQEITSRFAGRVELPYQQQVFQ
jgi:hypothetical protein